MAGVWQLQQNGACPCAAPPIALTPDRIRTPDIDPASPLLFVINGASGRNHADLKRDTLQAVLHEAGRTGELLFAQPHELARVAGTAAASALARRTAVVAVGGDGTINAVAQAAHAHGCPLGVVAQGTFNYFARTHGLPTEIGEAVRALLGSAPVPVQVGTVNDHLFLVNASLGLYPELLEDREVYKKRFGRSRWVALLSAFATLMRQHRQLRLHIELAGQARDLRTPTLFVGNNRLQLEQVGLREAPALDAGRLAAVMLRPIRTRSMLWLLLQGAFGTLGDAPTVESFEFEHIVVRPWAPFGGRLAKVAFDGEITWLRSPLEFRVSPRPLYLLKPLR
jgi:diacylglycerol kinase family enzyme